MKRNTLYIKSKEQNPCRWSKQTRDWSEIEEVKLNPEKCQATPTKILRSTAV